MKAWKGLLSEQQLWQVIAYQHIVLARREAIRAFGLQALIIQF
jgi:hypothetical protein